MDPTDTGPPNDAGGAEAAADANGQNPPVENPDAVEGEEGPKADPNGLDFNVPLPHDIHVDRMSRISDVKSIWRSGIKQIEEIFADHIAKINDLFD